MTTVERPLSTAEIGDLDLAPKLRVTRSRDWVRCGTHQDHWPVLIVENIGHFSGRVVHTVLFCLN